MPDANGNPTIGDAIAADVTATGNQATAATAAAAADRSLADASTAKISADKSLADGLALVGPAFTIDTDGRVTVYLPDSSLVGFHTIAPAPVNTPLPAPAPTPTPTPPTPPVNPS